MASYSSESKVQVAVPEMCVFCFDVLYSELYNLDPPAEPRFTNEALYVAASDPLSIHKCNGNY